MLAQALTIVRFKLCIGLKSLSSTDKDSTMEAAAVSALHVKSFQ